MILEILYVESHATNPKNPKNAYKYIILGGFIIVHPPDININHVWTGFHGSNVDRM